MNSIPRFREADTRIDDLTGFECEWVDVEFEIKCGKLSFGHWTVKLALIGGEDGEIVPRRTLIAENNDYGGTLVLPCLAGTGQRATLGAWGDELKVAVINAVATQIDARWADEIDPWARVQAADWLGDIT